MAVKADKKKSGFNIATIPKTIINAISEIATRVAIEVFIARFEQYKADEKDRRLRNTKLLLQNYRMLDEYNRNAIYDVAQLCANGMDSLLEIIGVQSGHKVESIEDSVIKTRLIMEHVDTMLDAYRARCERSQRDEVKRRWRVVWKMYIGPDRMTPEEVAETENIGRSTVYNDIDIACKDLSTLFFGIDCLALWK